MNRYISNPIEVIAIQFDGENIDEFRHVNTVTAVYGPFNAEDVDGSIRKSIEIQTRNFSFEIWKNEWAIFYPNGRAEWRSDSEFGKCFTELYDSDIDRWQDEGGHV